MMTVVALMGSPAEKDIYENEYSPFPGGYGGVEACKRRF